MELRSSWKKLRNNKARKKNGTERSSAASTGIHADLQSSPSWLQYIKDFVYHYYYFPDQIAAPWLKPAVEAGVKLVRDHSINIIFATGMPWTALVIGRLVAKKTGIPFVADFRDPWLGNPFLMSKGRLLDWRERRCEQKVVEEASLVTTNTVPLRQEFIRRYPQVLPEKIISLPNGYDIQDFQYLRTRNSEDNVVNDKLVLVHAGFLYGKRDPAPLFDALNILCQKNPILYRQIEFHQYGGINVSYNVKQRYRELFDHGIIKLFGQVPYQKCIKKMFQADVLVIIQPGTKTQVPSKLYDYLCINRPILTITPTDGALGAMIRQEGFGDLFAPEEIQPLMEKLEELCRLKQSNQLPQIINYPNRHKFDVRHIVRTLEEEMVRIVSSAA